MYDCKMPETESILLSMGLVGICVLFMHFFVPENCFSWRPKTNSIWIAPHLQFPIDEEALFFLRCEASITVLLFFDLNRNWRAFFGQNLAAKAAAAWVQKADRLYIAWISGKFGALFHRNLKHPEATKTLSDICLNHLFPWGACQAKDRSGLQAFAMFSAEFVDQVANKIRLRWTRHTIQKSSNVSFFHLILPLSNCFHSRPNLGHQYSNPAETNRRSEVSAMVWNRSTIATGRCEFIATQKIVKQRTCIAQGARLSIFGLMAIAATNTKQWPWNLWCFACLHQQLHSGRTRSSKSSALKTMLIR